jgi:hypothetical protein
MLYCQDYLHLYKRLGHLYIWVSPGILEPMLQGYQEMTVLKFTIYI